MRKVVKTGMKESCKYCVHLRRSGYTLTNNGKSKLYCCRVHGNVCGWVDAKTDKGLDTQGCSDFVEATNKLVLKPGDKFKCKTVLGTECVLLYLGSEIYTEYGRERKVHYTYLVSNSKGILKDRIRKWGYDETPRNIYKEIEKVEQNPVQHEASKRIAKKRLNKIIKEGMPIQDGTKVCKQEYGRKSCKGWTFYYLDGKFIIGIDESYSRLGMSLMYDNKVVETVSIDYKGCTNNSQKRKEVSKELSDLIKRWRLDRRDATIIVERIRLRSQGFLSESYMKSTGALVATIIDTAYKMNIPVYSVDTRSWKSQIVGTSKPKENKYGIDSHKWPTILYLKQKGLLKHIAYPYKGKSTKGVIKVNMGLTEGVVNCRINDDVADSICIAMYGFLPEKQQKLKEEKF